MSQDWELTQLGEIASIKHGYAFKSEYFSNYQKGKPIVVNIGNFRYAGGFRFENTSLKSYEGSYPQEFVLKPDDILLVMTCQTPGGEILGIPGRIPANGNTYLHNQRMGKVIIKDKKKIDANFLYWLFLMPSFNQHLVTTATGTKILHTAPERVESFQFLLPSLPIQRTIANILSAYDNLIENNTRRITILEQTTQTLYQEWFVNFRFPGYEQVEMVESEFGVIPNGWEFTPLEDIAGVNLHNIKSGLEPEEIYYIDISSVSTGIIQKVEMMPFNLAPGRARRIVKHGDIIWSTVRPNRKSYSIILNPPEDLIVSTGFAVITANSVPYTYLYSALTTDDFTAYLTNHATGSAYPAVNSKDFQAALILQLPKKLLDLFHSITSSIFQRQHILHKQNAILRQTRDMLLPKLISGELDVSSWSKENAEEIAQEAASSEPEAQPYAEAEPVIRKIAETRSITPTPIEKDALEQTSLWG